MIKPSEVDTSEFFWDSRMQDTRREVIARNIALLSQIIAKAKGDDRWHPFSTEEYNGFRAATGTEPAGWEEQAELQGLVNDGYLNSDVYDNLSVTHTFLGVVAQFALPPSAEA